MRKSTSIFQFKCLLLFILFAQVGVAQLSNFTLTVSHTNETCTANGTLTFNTSGTTPGATMLFSIYLLPNTTTPIATVSGNTYSGLVAGTYRVVATQSLGADSGTQQRERTILNQIANLTYQISGQNASTCVNNGQITVNVSTGTAVSYEIFAGPVTRPLQPSNVFSNLPAGVYQIRVFDTCGEGVVQTHTLSSTPAALQISPQIFNPPLSCSSVLASHIFSAPAGSSIAYPLNVVLTVFPPAGPPVVYNQTITSGSPNSQTFSQDITLFPNQPYTYNIVVTDACGTVRSRNNNNVNSNIAPTATPSSQIMNCVTMGSVFIRVVHTVILVSAPAAYTANPLPYNFTGSIGLGSAQLNNLPVGTYTFNVTDVCGNPHVLQATIQPVPPAPFSFSYLRGCGQDAGSVKINSNNGDMVSIFVTEAPLSYPNPLPHDVSFNIYAPGDFFSMNSLPVGNYKFHFSDICGNQYEVPVALTNLQFSVNDFAVTPNCNSFNLEIHHTNNSGQSPFIGLQKFNPASGQWVHPGTGVPGNMFPLVNNSTNANLAFSGSFRVVLEHGVYGNGTPFNDLCQTVLYEFEFDGAPKINGVYSFSCSNNTFEVVVHAQGLGALQYRITTKNGQPFVIDNGNDSTFMTLNPAIYNFQVEDSCGNIVNSLHDISEPFGFQITAADFCNGQTASLAVPSFPFLVYQWWEAGAPNVILSTASQLLFPGFNPSTDQGTYFVSIVNPINATCIDQVQSYVVNANQALPNAGTNAAMSYCGNPATIDLFSLLAGPFDLNGTWTALSSGGSLVANIWDPTAVPPGIYQFKYTVTGFCNTSDEAVVTITLQPAVQAPTASVAPVVCEGAPLELFATAVPNATYEWTGPNGFTSAQQNPVISPVSAANNGLYSVQAIFNGCPSVPSAVEVQVVPLPEFIIDHSCIDNVAFLTATPVNQSFDQATATYHWSNADGFAASGNPVAISGEMPGVFNLTVTNDRGCSATNGIDVPNTLCSVPSGISPNNDGMNDVLDLTGFSGISDVRIFNRYGMTVFEQEKYAKEWRGQDKKGNILPSGTYFYLINFESSAPKTGWIYLLREND